MNLRDLIKKHEALRLAPYLDTVGKWTVGWGHNLESHNEPIPTDAISLEQAEAYFESDLADAIEGCRQLVPEFDSLGEVRQAVLVSMAFQMGKAGVAKFKRMLAYIKIRYWTQASAEMLDSAWATTQTPGRAKTLALMMATNQWPKEA